MNISLDPMVLLNTPPQAPDTSRALQDRESLKKSCQEFEALFIQSLFKAMRKTVPESDLFEENTSTELYRDMLDMEIAQTISQRQSIGLAEQMYRQMEQNLPPMK